MTAGRKARGEAKRAFAVAIGLMVSAPALTQSLDMELIPYAVHVDRSPKQLWPGYGVYLGNG